MNWRPLQAHNAIERVRLSVRFKQPMSERLSKKLSEQIAGLRNETRLVGPEVRAGVQIVHDGVGLPKTSEIQSGWQFVRTSSNGAALEALVCEGDTFLYETSEYQRWEVFRRRFDKAAGGALAIAFETLDIAAVALEYYDRFVYDGPSDTANVEQLLPEMAGRLHANVISGKSLWHYHTGWFEDCDGGQVLINQNYDAQDGRVSGSDENVRSVAMLTRAELQDPHYRVTPETFSGNLELLHTLTKSYFQASISNNLYAAVGLS